MLGCIALVAGPGARLALIEYAKARSADETLRALCLQK